MDELAKPGQAAIDARLPEREEEAGIGALPPCPPAIGGDGCGDGCGGGLFQPSPPQRL
jgi:hypothetical protein